MIEHTQNQIEGMRNFLDKNSLFRVEGKFSNRNIEYFVTSQSLNPDLPDFICRASNKELGDYVFGVSDSIPSEIQPYFALAEYIEFMEKGQNAENRVADAEKETVKSIPKTFKDSYIKRKLAVYEKELELNQKDPETYALGNEGKKEFENAIQYLKSELIH